MSHESNRIILQADHVATIARALVKKGCEVESIQLGGSRPVIYIEPNRAAAKLQHAMYKRVVSNGVRKCYWTAMIHGCSVRWQTEEGAAARMLSALLPIERSGTGISGVLS